MKVDLKGLFLGGALGVVWSILVGVVAGILMVVLKGGQPLDLNGIIELSLFFLGSVIGYLGSGYLVAWISENNRLFTAIVIGIVITIWSLYPSSDGWSFKAISAVTCIPMHYLGAILYATRANKIKNEDASRAGTDAAHERRPF